MQINLSKLYGAVTILVALGLTGVTGYFFYLIFFNGPVPEAVPTNKTLNVSTFGPKIQKAAAILSNSSQKIGLKKADYIFTDSDLFKSFQVVPDEIPLTDSRGRANPFVPYVAP